MNTLHIASTTYCEVEQKLGILTDDGFEKLLDQLLYISANRLNSGMVEYTCLDDSVKLMKSLTIERNDQWGNTLTIENYEDINRLVFDNQSNKENIKRWLLKGMLEDIAELIDEGYRYGMDSSEETVLLNNFLFYLTLLKVRFQ